jgi:serine/threonine protein kinase
MVGKVLAQYQICEKLGEGGMGLVWKARDTRLDRFVALKTLPAERVADPERKRRFAQEAKSASALNHPNIVHIYDIADADGMQFIAMEYVHGKTLEQLIGRKGLRLNEVLKYALQIADALAKAAWSRCWTSASPSWPRLQRASLTKKRIQRSCKAAVQRKAQLSGPQPTCRRSR